AIGIVFVPGRWQAQYCPGIAGAQGAHHDVVHRGGVLQHNDLGVLWGTEAEFGDRCGAVRQEALSVRWIDPGPGHDSGAVEWTNVLLVGAHDGVDHIRTNQPLLHQQRFQRFGAQRRGRFWPWVMTVMVVATHYASPFSAISHSGWFQVALPHVDVYHTVDFGR